MQNNCDTSDDEISLSELWQGLVRYKWWVAGVPIATMVVAFLVTNLIKPQWEAVALVQIGQVGGALVESADRAVERMKQTSFQWGAIKVKAVPNVTDLIEISVRGYSREEAKAKIEATVAYLRAIHDRMAAPTIERLKQQLVRVKQQLESARVARDSLTRIAELRQQPHSGDRFMANVELANITLKRDAELRDLEQAKVTVEEQLRSNTYPTSLFDKVFVGGKPVAPKKLLATGLSGLVGLIVGMLAAFALNSVRARSGQTTAIMQSQ